MDSLLASGALYVCTNILLGRPGPNNGVTVFLDRDGRGGPTPGPAALRIRLTPDGKLIVAAGNGRGYSLVRHGGIRNRTITSPRLAMQEDEDPVNTNWWQSVANGRALYKDQSRANYTKTFKGGWVLFYHVTRTG